jgi:hypothetical protein
MITNAQEARALTDSATLATIQPILDEIEKVAMAGGSDTAIGVDPSVLDSTVDYLQKAGFTVQIQEAGGAQVLSLAKDSKLLLDAPAQQTIIIKW